MPKLYYASPRDLPQHSPASGVTERIIQADHATIALTDLVPRTVVETHKHDVEEVGVVTRGSLVLVIAGEQRILAPGDSYRVPPGASHGARVFEEAAALVAIWAPRRNDQDPSPPASP